MDTKEIDIEGEIERVTYTNSQNGYTVARFLPKGKKENITITGNMFALAEGESLAIKGEWIVNEKYGKQFNVSSYRSIIPATAQGIERYLGSGLIRGVGRTIAKRIVSHFGVKSLDIIENSINRLNEIEGIGVAKVQMIGESWAQQKYIKEVMVFLQSYGVGIAHANKIFKAYGSQSVSVVKNNPYRLATDIFGIGFTMADKIAENLGIPKEAQIRAEAGILYILQQEADKGHVYYPYDLLIEESYKILNINRDTIVSAFDAIALANKIVVQDLKKAEKDKNKRAVFLPKFFVSESGIKRYLQKIISTPKKKLDVTTEKIIDWASKEMNIKLASNQINAIKEALKNKVLVITGGPGTGKTTIIKSIMKIYHQSGQEILLAAPTGRAAKRMTETTGFPGKTIHRLLEFNPKQGGFNKNEHSPLKADLIVLDETSMVDTLLMYNFLKAVPPQATLIFVGDIDQLPSVGSGSVLKDFITSNVIPVVTLNEIFRQAAESLIITNAHRVNRGEMPFVIEDKKRLYDFYFIHEDDPEKILKRIISLCNERIPEKFKFHPVKDIQVLTAMHKGVIGRINLNNVLQESLNINAVELIINGRSFKREDKVIQVVNNYDKDVFNGDIGSIAGINTDEQILTVDFDGRFVNYEFKELDDIDLAYAISIHKSQGSEYPAVIVPIHTQQYILLQRNILYTAITRGKKLVVLVGTKRAIAIAIKNDKPKNRYTMLEDRLREIN